jgi:hypothetical protein
MDDFRAHRGRMILGLLGLALALVAAGCSLDTSRLTPEAQQRLEAEGIVRRADNLVFRYTHDVGRRDAGWEDRRSSIVVTRQSVLIHKNDRVGIEITPRTRRFCEVRRDGERVRIRAGSGGASESWSFVPPDDAPGWTTDIRAVIRGSKSIANPKTND